MSLVLDFSVCQSSDCTQFTFNELTGIYNATTNPTGWGSPNDTLADVTTPVTLDVTFPNGTVYSIDVATENPSFPTDDTSLDWDLDMSSFGGQSGDEFPDGIYTFEYTVTTINDTYTQIKTVAFYCQVKCCVFSMLKDINPECDCCDADKQNAIDAYLMYQGLVYQSGCGNITQFNTTLEALQKICTQSSCKNCK